MACAGSIGLSDGIVYVAVLFLGYARLGIAEIFIPFDCAASYGNAVGGVSRRLAD